MKNVARLSGIASAAAIILILLYLQINTSGHTGINPNLANLFFIPAVLAGCFNIISRRSDRLWGGVIAAFTGVAGITLLIYLDRSNTLLQYETWFRRGMP